MKKTLILLLIAFSFFGCEKETDSKKSYNNEIINPVIEAPIAKILLSTYAPELNVEMTFYNETVNYNECVWLVTDGIVIINANDANPNFIFDRSGSYVIFLFVSNEAGQDYAFVNVNINN